MRGDMSTPNYENLRVLKLAEEIGDEIWDLVSTWDSFARWTIGKQIVDTADGIGANIAEGAGRGSFQDNRRFIKISRACLNETRFWLRRAERRRIISQPIVDKLFLRLDRLGPMINAYLASIGKGYTSE
jgi:four helix bundle protein